MRRQGKFGRRLSLALLLGALVGLAVDVFAWWRDDYWDSLTLGAAWAGVNANSLVGLGAFVEKSISPWLWIEIMVPILTLPLWLFFALPGAVLLRLTRRKRRRSIFYKK